MSTLRNAKHSIVQLRELDDAHAQAMPRAPRVNPGDCDMNASIVNPNCIISATHTDKLKSQGNSYWILTDRRRQCFASPGAPRANADPEDGRSRARAPEMLMARMSDRSRSGRRSVSSLAADLLGLLNDLTRRMFDPYRPELHYMRGPGPKWHAKYGRGSTHFDNMPALARIHVKR